IVKPGVPVVVGDLPPVAAAVIDRVARERGAEVVRTSPLDVEGFTIGLPGAHQASNAAVAVKLLEVVDRQGITVPRTAVARGLQRPDWPAPLGRPPLPRSPPLPP